VHRTALVLLLALGLAAGTLPAAEAQSEGTRLLRFPDIHGDRVVFVYAGDLWLASADGGPARRLTSPQAQELFPTYSPDGTRVAFTGHYDGDGQV
jgi:tricorn protease